MTSRLQLGASAITSGYGMVRIINDISFAVRPGDIVAVTGRNGVGKSTLVKIIVGLLPAMSGQLTLGDTEITGLSTAKRARLGIGYVPQGRGIFTRITVAANLSLGAGIGRAKRADLKRVFSFFPILEKRLSQLAGSMSGGEQQQLAIGRVLAGRPSVMLLDEPSEGVQPNVVQDIGRIIGRLRDQEGLTIMLVEQNLALIQAVADYCVVMDTGIIIATVRRRSFSTP